MESAVRYQVRQSWSARLSNVCVNVVGRLLRRLMWRLFALNAAAVSFWVTESPFVFAAMATLARFRVFDLLVDGPQTVTQLAAATQCDADALLRLLRTVSAVGLLKRRADGRFALNAVSRQFLSTSPNPVAAWCDLILDFMPLMPQMPDAVRAGQPLMKFATGKTCWDFLATLPRGTELHDRAMNAWTALVIDKVAASYDFSAAKTIVDVGGGRGSLLCAFLRAAPHLHGTVVDRENTRLEAMENFQQHGVEQRATHVVGNFFESIPAGADLYSIKHALHDWDDEHVLKILQTIRTAIPPHGKFLIVEGAVDHELVPGASVRAVWDLTQWVATWGKERTLDEFQRLLEAAGFRMENVYLTPTIDALIIESMPV